MASQHWSVAVLLVAPRSRLFPTKHLKKVYRMQAFSLSLTR